MLGRDSRVDIRTFSLPNTLRGVAHPEYTALTAPTCA